MIESFCGTHTGCRSVLRIRRSAVEHNVRRLSSFSGKKLIAVIKSDAYGMGVKYVAPILRELPEVESFAVACVDEGVLLRELGVKREILILGGVLPEELEAVKEHGLTPVVSDTEHLKVIGRENIRFHVKYDTGMGRLGFINEFIDDPRVVGVMSHLSTPADREFSSEQIERFRKIMERYKGRRLKVHLESSAGVIYRVPYTTHIRVGLAIYGEKPLRDYPLDLKPAVSVQARVLSVKEVPAGYPISYGRTFVTERRTRIGVVAFGYADGLMKSLSNRGYLLHGDRKLPILGNITMDMTVVDVSGADVRAGDWVTVVDERRTFGELAKEAGTIPYELMCNVSSRVRREVI
ncbi:alanine racemase [Hydrogenivirga sp.]